MTNNLNKVCLVATSIGDGKFLDNYSDNVINDGLLDNTQFIVIPDLKTPKSFYTKVKENRKRGVNIVCPTIEEQDQYLKKLGKISKIIPYNTDNRRNIGYLMAYQQHCDTLISIDDDNYPTKDTGFFKQHITGLNSKDDKTQVVSSSNKWLNICEYLTTDQKKIFARGFPYYARTEKGNMIKKNNKQKIAINAGLWLNEPDVDAMTWLSCPPKVTKFNSKSFTIDENTWSPINTQNTSLIGEAIPSYYFIKMGYTVKGLNIDRYGDIFSGYFALKCVKHLNMTARFGSPVVNHIRNSHNYMKDITSEIMCIQLLEHLLPKLQDAKLDGNNFIDTYTSLSNFIDEVSEELEICQKEKGFSIFMHETAKNMRVWVNTIKAIDF
ncbi:MAG: hypothetical protein GYA62_15265 [Bacteroidales bacterium]|nr:hypothetical protein [Bacteroidales bacterium]